MNNEKQFTPKISENDLPAIFRAADKSSISAQRRYLYLVIFDLGLMILGAISTSLPLGVGQIKTIAAIAGAIVIGISLILMLVMKIAAYEDLWYSGRAIAESVKTLTWRYMICAEPYFRECRQKDIDTQFISHLEMILKARKSLGLAMAGDANSGDQITQRMRDIRESNFEDQKKIYLEARVVEQKDWYGNRAKANDHEATIWLIIVAISKIFAIASAILLVRWPSSSLNIAPIFAALGASFMAWSQVKRHQELALSYSVASHELGFILAKAEHIKTNKELSDFLLDAENAISREHTLWIARRDREISYWADKPT